MPRQKSLITVIRDLVRQEISSALSSLLGTGTARTRRTRRRRRGPGRPPGSKTKTKTRRRRGRPPKAD
ncbi:MAG: hypothetical protein E6J76_14270 [Deltaproteobacteria bacterium]|nr:MAG: hypothetical protein E6J76_14270 [Deltaproteobacteria bacterium]TMA77980.1 MAG: hypothetical protein E6J77_21930 [Deltaproteobacteria bacterium]